MLNKEKIGDYFLFLEGKVVYFLFWEGRRVFSYSGEEGRLFLVLRGKVVFFLFSEGKRSIILFQEEEGREFCL